MAKVNNDVPISIQKEDSKTKQKITVNIDQHDKIEKNDRPIYILVEKERKKHQALVERMTQSSKKKDNEIGLLKKELKALKEAIFSTPIVFSSNY